MVMREGAKDVRLQAITSAAIEHSNVVRNGCAFVENLEILDQLSYQVTKIPTDARDAADARVLLV